MPLLQLNTVSEDFDVSNLSKLVKNRASRYHLDLSNYNLVGVISAYQAHERKKSPNYSNSSAMFQILDLQNEIGQEIMPIDVCDDFWLDFEPYLLQKGIRPSTIENYFAQIRASLTWAGRHNCRLSESYDEYEVGKYTRTKVALTPDEVSLIAHFDIAGAYELKDEDFMERAKAMLKEDIEREQSKRESKCEKLIAHARKNYNTAVNRAKKMYEERLARHKVSAHKRQKAEMLYVADMKRAQGVLETHVNDAKRLCKGLSKSEMDKLLCARVQGLKNQSKAMRDKKIENLERVRNQFVLQCSLGQRYSDMIRISPLCFSDDLNTFTITQQKTANKAVVDIDKFAFDKKVVRAILLKYNCMPPYPHNLSNFNRLLKELIMKIGFTDIVRSENKINGKMVIEESPKYNVITSHTARRTFATYNMSRGFSEINVRRATGHSDSRSFQRYIIFDED